MTMKGRALLLAGMASGILGAEPLDNYRSVAKKPAPRAAATLTNKAWKKRKARLSAVKKSRQINRF